MNSKFYWVITYIRPKMFNLENPRLRNFWNYWIHAAKKLELPWLTLCMKNNFYLN